MEAFRQSIDNDDRIYRGIVVDNSDPQSKGRVRVRISCFHGTEEDIPNENIPWADVIQHGASANAGSFIVPEVGSMVVVLFEGGNHNAPIVIGSIYASNRTKEAKYKTSSISNEASGGRKASAKTNDTPYDGQGDIASRIIYQSPKGGAIAVYDQDDSEAIELKDANGQVLRLSSPLTQEATKNNNHQSGNAKESLVNVCTILLKNNFGQMLQILSNGSDGIITLFDETSKQGLEINSSLGYTRMYNKNGNGSEILVDKDVAVLRTDKSEIKIDNSGNITIKGDNINISGSTMKLNANSMTIEAPNIKMNGNIKGGTLVEAHHQPGFVVSGSGSGPSNITPDPIVDYVNPKDKLDTKVETNVKSNAENLASAQKILGSAKSVIGSLKDSVSTLKNSNASLSSAGNKLLNDISRKSGVNQGEALSALSSLASNGEISIDNITNMISSEANSFKDLTNGNVRVTSLVSGKSIEVSKNIADFLRILGSTGVPGVTNIAETLYNASNTMKDINQKIGALESIKGLTEAKDISGLFQAMSSITNIANIDTKNINGAITALEAIYNNIEMTKALVDRCLEDCNSVLAPSSTNKELKKGSMNRVLLQSKAVSGLVIKSLESISTSLSSIAGVLGIESLSTACQSVSVMCNLASGNLSNVTSNVESVTSNIKSTLKLLTAKG